jgi:hypothetical protein
MDAPETIGVSEVKGDSVQWTITPSIDDYRHSVQEAGWQFRLVGFSFAVLMLGAIISAFAKQWIGAAIMALFALGILSLYHIVMRQSFRSLPSSALAPVTLTFTPTALEVHTEDLLQVSRWRSFTEVRQTSAAWYFVGPGQVMVPLFRRELTAQDEELLRSTLERYAPHLDLSSPR